MRQKSWLTWFSDKWYLFLIVPAGLWALVLLIDRVINSVSAVISQPYEEPGPAGLSSAQAKSYAERIYEGMSYSWASDNYAKVVNTIQLLENANQVQQVHESFGTRQEYHFGIPAGKPVGMFNMMSRNLPDWAKKKVNNHLQKLNSGFQV